MVYIWHAWYRRFCLYQSRNICIISRARNLLNLHWQYLSVLLLCFSREIFAYEELLSKVCQLAVSVGELFIGCLLSHAIFQERISSDYFSVKFMCSHTEVEAADRTFYFAQSHYTDTVPVLRVATGVPIFESLLWLDQEKSCCKWDSNPGSSALEADALTTGPMRWSCRGKASV